MSPSELGHKLPSLLHNSENVIVAHGYGQESTEGKVPTQNSMDKQDELETTVLSTFLGMSTPWMSRGAWKSPSPADLCVSVCAFWMWIPLSVFQTRVQARGVSAASRLREAGGRVLSPFTSDLPCHNHPDHYLLRM